MSTTKDAKTVTPAKEETTYKLVFNWTFFYLHFFIWLILIACFGIIAEF